MSAPRPSPRNLILGLVALLAAVLWIAPAASADPGDLETTFSGDGKVTTEVGGSSDVAHDVAVQRDGRIVVVGTTGIDDGYYGVDYYFVVARYLPNGKLDQSFGNGGTLFSYLGGDSVVRAVVLLPDGRIVVAGSAGGSVGVARYLPDGNPDRTFGGDGEQVVDVSPGVDVANAVALYRGGSIVLAGCRDAFGQSDFLAVRLTANGALDPKFGIEGKARTDFVGGDDCASAVAVQDDGAIVSGGDATVAGKTRFAAVRYKPGGGLDDSFSRDGKFTTDFRPPEETATGLDLQENGRIVLAGSARGPQFSENHFTLARLRPNGSLDRSFSDDGRFMSPFGDSAAQDVEVLGNGKIVAAGWTRQEDEHRFVVERYLPQGKQDRAFGHRGRAVVDLAPRATSDAEALGIDVGGGRLVTAGRSGDDLALVVYEA